MRQRPGYTLVELITVMAIFMIATGIVVADFRQNNEREYLKQTAVDAVNLLSTMQGWSLGNKQIPTCAEPDCRASFYGVIALPAPDGFVPLLYNEIPNPLPTYNPYPAIPEFPLRTTIEVVEVRLDEDKGSNAKEYVFIGFKLPDGRPIGGTPPFNNFNELNQLSPKAVYIYFKNTRLSNRNCRRISALPSGLISQDEVPATFVEKPNACQ